jgi:GntP family gluconate:H+ symporter
VILTVAMLLVLAGVLWARLHPFLVLIVTALVVAALTPPERLGEAAALPIGRRVAEGFGKTAHDIGILIAMASILGQCLMEARGAERIVAAIERLVGRRRAAFAFLGAGFLLGIPMFAEAVFYLLLPLAKASWRETRRNGVLLVLSIVAGATMTHSLVPPTPGPLFVADEMGIDIALMMRQGMIVGAIAALAGYGYATWADRRFAIPLRTAGDEVPGRAPADTRPGTEAGKLRPGTEAGGELPPLWASLLPILLPVVLISADSAVDSIAAVPDSVARIIHVVGDKNLALTVSAAAAILLLACRPGASREKVRRAVAAAVLEGGEIILVIAAGGALGATLRQAGMAELAAAAVPKQAILLLPIAWGVTVLIRAAQGSATVAMITAVGIIAPISDAASLPYNEVYVALAIGCGSKPGMWMNDSGFWVISRMTGMTETETLKTASVMVAIEGIVGLLATMALATIWPIT